MDPFKWPAVSCPEDAGISSKGLLDYLDAVEKSGLEHHAVVVLRHGKLACRMDFAPYDGQTPHQLFSLSKSFTSAAAGFAVQEGLLRWDSRVCDVLPEATPENADGNLKSITLHHLLCMGSGLFAGMENLLFQHYLLCAGPGPRPGSGDVWSGHWAKEILACGCDHAPGTHFHYNSHGTYLISCMVQKVTGQTVRDYLTPRLFEKLGIPKPEFDLSPEGVCCGGWGLHLSADSIARFGQCLLQNGVWQGEQVLPPEWLAKAKSFQISNAESQPDPDSEWAQGYGYQFWRCREGRWRGDGMYGQVCMIDEKLDMVVAVTAGLNDMGKEMELLREHLFPAARMEPGTEKDRVNLEARLHALCHPWPENDGSGTMEEADYESEDRVLRFHFGRDGISFDHLPENGGMGGHVDIGLLRLAESQGTPTGFKFLGKCGWQKGALRFAVRTPEAPFMMKGVCVFHGDMMTLETEGVGLPTLKAVLKRC